MRILIDDLQSNSDKVINSVLLTSKKRIPKLIYLISWFFPFSYYYQ
ncbi:hypothetical protein EU97_1845 [Prochlorococcus marinus str. MIT 9311]|nr:hypothetical protein EU97_1845 [Prochlorococcus marinus str. MIT 9311]